MRKRWLLFLAIAMWLQVAHAQNKADAVKYNNTIVAKQHSITAKFKEFFNTFETKNADQTEKARTALVKYIDKQIKSLDGVKLNGYADDHGLKQAAMELFAFYKNTLQIDYPEMLRLKRLTNPTADDKQKLKEMLDDVIAKEELQDTRFEQIQVLFVTDLGLEFE